jgi:TctA family transporter
MYHGQIGCPSKAADSGQNGREARGAIGGLCEEAAANSPSEAASCGPIITLGRPVNSSAYLIVTPATNHLHPAPFE